jgi:hypothetical protein
MLRGGGVEVRKDEIRGDDGPPFADKGGEGKGRKILDVAVDPFEELESKAPSNFSACEESMPPNVSSNEMAADGSNEVLRVGQVDGWVVVVGAEPTVSRNENGFDASTGVSEGVPLFSGTLKTLSNPLVSDEEVGVWSLPLIGFRGGGKLGLLADGKSKLSSNAVAKEKLRGEVAAPLLGIIPMASSKTFTPAT